MKQTDISMLITARLNYYGYGRGNSYTTYLNGTRVWGGIADLRKTAKEGDYVQIKVYSIRGDWYKDTVEFTIKADDRLLAEEKQYKKTTPRYGHRDSQKQRVYNWERVAVGLHERIPYESIVELVDRIHSDYGVNSPKVVVTPQRKRKSVYVAWGHKIVLAEGWGQRKDVVVHECVHSLIHCFNWDVQSHGGEFVKLAAELYEKYLGIRNALDQASRFRLKVNHCFVVNKSE